MSADLLIDPDCQSGKHARPDGGGCVGGPCECKCHAPMVIAPGAFKVGQKATVKNTAGLTVGECEITSVDGDRVQLAMRLTARGAFGGGIFTADIPPMSFKPSE